MDCSVRYTRGVGPGRAALLERLGIVSRGDLLLHLPRRYLDRRRITEISALEVGTEATVRGVVAVSGERRTRGGRKLFHAVIEDGTGRLTLTFFNAGYLARRLSKGVRLLASGRVEAWSGLSMAHPGIDFLDESETSELEGGAVIPVYPLCSGLSQGVMRRLVAGVLDDLRGSVPEVLPPSVLAGGGFGSRWDLFDAVHRPSSPGEAESARRLLALEELLVFQSMLSEIRAAAVLEASTPIAVPDGGMERFFSALPFSMTRSQCAVVEEILSDMGSATAMRRLVQGEVGCGKTVVAAAACWACACAGRQSVVLAPTEVLAAQHEKTLSRLFHGLPIRTALLTGGTPARARRAILEEVASGETDVLVGTHALLEPGARPPLLSLLVVDEQHKFGVEQREALLRGFTPRPHMLVISATPIPRTLAMTLYGDLDLSRIEEMPPGRGVIRTRVVGPEGRARVFRFMLERLALGERAFVVYPLRDTAEGSDLRDAVSGWEALRRGPAGRYGVGLVHGAMGASEKLAASEDFAEGRTSVLVGTTVVEVGLDVPSATVMIVAHADRFGLSQLHQLRGRIGRGGGDAWCFLMSDGGASAEARERLAELERTGDGLEIARKDLELRGPGDLAGTRQHGLPLFRVADLCTDSDLVESARALAADPANAATEREIRWRFGESGAPGV